MPLCFLSVVSLAACQTPLIPVINQVVNLGIDLPDDMQHRNVSAVVAFDETWSGNYPSAARNQLYTQGIKRGTPEYGMRVVRINMRHTDGFAWIPPGRKVWITSAIVPDQIAPLKGGDLVEIRQTGTWDVDKDFVATGEGNIVLRVLCVKASSDYVGCVKKEPHIGEYEGFGATGTLYPVSIQAYGYSYTPMYDAEGKPLR